MTRPKTITAPTLASPVSPEGSIRELLWVGPIAMPVILIKGHFYDFGYVFAVLRARVTHRHDSAAALVFQLGLWRFF